MNKKTKEKIFYFDKNSKTINIYKNQIYEILDFISKEEQKLFLDLAINSEEKNWPINFDNEFQKNDQGISGTVMPLENLYRKEREEIEKRIESLFKNSTRINNIAAIQRYKPSKGMGIHKDDILDSSVKYGLVIYLNDDYEGGEINYPDLNLTIKPKARSIIFHPAGIDHQVLEVKGNKTRYIFSSFIRGDEKLEVFDVE